MVTPYQIFVLKKIAFIADALKDFGALDFSRYKFKINSLIEDHEDLCYAFKILNINYELYRPKRYKEVKEIGVTIGFNIDVKVIFSIVYILREIYGNNDVDIYINYSTKPETECFEINFGSNITRNVKAYNASRRIEPNEILQINVDNFNKNQLTILFPIENYSEWGNLSYTIIVDSKKDWEDDDCFFGYDSYGSSYESYGSYNGYSDDVIDDAFEGDPMNTWNVD